MAKEVMEVILKVIEIGWGLVVGPILGIAGYFLTKKGMRMQKESKMIDWAQLQVAAKSLSKKVRDFEPDIIICPGQKGGIFAQLMVDELEIQVPIYTGFMVPKGKQLGSWLTVNYFSIDTTKWHVFLPSCIEQTKDCKVLIIDDFVMSGDFLLQLMAKLDEFGYDKNKIKSCSIATTDVAKGGNKAPDFYWKTVDASDFYFPWGSAK